MTVSFGPGYTLPGGDLPLKHARILHEGNRFPIKSVVATAEVPNYPGSAANSGDTVDRWRSWSNVVEDPTNVGASSWIKTGATVASDGQTITDDNSTGNHRVLQTYTYPAAVSHVLAFEIERQTAPEVRVSSFDGTSTFACYFDLRDKTVGSASAGTTGRLVDLGNNRFLCSITFTPLAAFSNFQIMMTTGSENISYTGTSSQSIKVLRASLHRSSAALEYYLFGALQGDVACIAAHNLGSSGSRVIFQHDSNADGTWTTLAQVTPSDDSPIMLIGAPTTSDRFRIVVDQGALPEVGVFRVGKALQMERPFYGGFTPPRMNRATEVIANLSGTGELLGRSKKRTVLSSEYQWNNLTYTWVRANLDGPRGLIQAAEANPLFIAWRPGETQDVEYLMRAKVEAPRAVGTRDLFAFAMSGEAYSYE